MTERVPNETVEMIQATRDSSRDDDYKIRRLTNFAMVARDRGDMASFVAVNDVIREIKPNRIVPSFSHAFQEMYAERPRHLILHEKHDTRHYHLLPNDPDRFAHVMLGILGERQNENYYLDSKLDIWPVKGAVSEIDQVWFDMVLIPYLKTVSANAVNGSFLSSFKAVDVVSLAITRAPEANLLNILGKLIQEASSDNDCLVALLTYIVFTRFNDAHRDYDGAIRQLLAQSWTGPAMAAVRERVPVGTAERVEKIFLEAKLGNFRHAGRIAYEFLLGRSQAQYERIEIRRYDEPTFTIRTIPGEAA